MGNGKGIISVDIETSSLTENDLLKSINTAIGNFGQPNVMYTSPNFMSMMKSFIWEANPEFSPLPWATVSRLTKRERQVAWVHVFLFKLSVLKAFSEDDHSEFKKTAIKRLKRASWASYGKRKKNK